jgi:hypothetical protein
MIRWHMALHRMMTKRQSAASSSLSQSNPLDSKQAQTKVYRSKKPAPAQLRTPDLWLPAGPDPGPPDLVTELYAPKF